MRTLVTTLLLTVLLATESWGQGPVPVSGEFQINTVTTLYQSVPAVARLNDDDFVVVWQSAHRGSPGSPTLDIQGQRYDSRGQALGTEFSVNTYTTGSQRSPAVSTLADGSFVVVWRSGRFEFANGSIQGQRYAADGSPLGDQFQINSYTTGSHTTPSVAGLSDSDFVVVWDHFLPSGSRSSLLGQRFASDGDPVGAQFQVNSYTAPQSKPSVAALAYGGFVTVWASSGSTGTDNWGSSIQGRIFDADGGALGDDFQINDYTTSFQSLPSVAGLADGGFVSVWTSHGTVGRDASQFSIQGQRYDAVGTQLGTQFEVNTYSPGDQRWPTVAAEPGGGFVVAWESGGSSTTDDSYTSIHARRFSANGEGLGGDFQVNTTTHLFQDGPSVAALAEGGFVATWHSFGSGGSDDSGYSIQGQLFDGPRFAITGLADKCLDVEGGLDDDGTPVNLYRCHDELNQVWRLDQGTAPQQVKSFGGKCLIPGPVDEAGDTRIVIGGCSEGGDMSDKWQWVPVDDTHSSALMHLETGLCLDVQGAASDDGTPTILFECHGRANQAWRQVPKVCTRGSQGLCLADERFRVDLEWTSFDGTTGTGLAVPVGSNDSGLMWFFEADNWEMLIKVLDGCAINDRLWVFAAGTTTVEYTLRITDTTLGAVVEYFNPLGEAAAAITDTAAFDTCGSEASAAPPAANVLPARVIPPPSGGETETLGNCIPSSNRLCVNDGRFALEVAWRDYAGNTGAGSVVPQQSVDSGMFHFFSANNWEMLVKVLDACDRNGRFWLLAAATTDVEYTLQVTDTSTGVVREYFNPLGNAAAALVDTFETCP